jgi:hypothetical protein
MPSKVKLTDVPEERLAKVAAILGVETYLLVDNLRVKDDEVGFFTDDGWCCIWSPEEDLAQD